MSGLSATSPGFSTASAAPTSTPQATPPGSAGGGSPRPQTSAPGPGGTSQPDPRTPSASDQALLRQFQQLQQQSQGYQRELGQLRTSYQRDSELLNRLRTALSPESAPKPPSKEEQYNQQLDLYLQAALEAERAGNPMPLTANLAAQFFEAQTENEREKTQLKKDLQKLQQQLQEVADPSRVIDQQAYASMDTFIQQGLDTIYGRGAEYAQQKNYQFKALGNQIADEIKDLKKNQPQVWDEIRRDREKIKRMVNYFVEQNLPPRARQILEQQRIQEEPQTVEGLMEAFREAHTRYADDPRALQQVVPRIRAELVSEIFAKKRGGGLNQVYGRGRG